MDRVARHGPIARAPGALKSHNAEKLKGGPFEVFQHAFCRKTSEKMQGDPLGKKMSRSAEKNVSQCRKKLKEGGLFGLARYGVTRKNR